MLQVETITINERARWRYFSWYNFSLIYSVISVVFADNIGLRDHFQSILRVWLVDEKIKKKNYSVKNRLRYD